MIFMTEVEFPKYNFSIQYSDPICLMGSCFSDHIGSKLLRDKFQVSSNPLGITFNPISLVRQLDYVLDPGTLRMEDLEQGNGLWHHFDFHGRFSNVSKEATFRGILTGLESTREFLFTSGFLFITMGTATVYRHKKSGNVVANNHKFPLDYFVKRRLEVIEIVDAFEGVLHELKKHNPDLKVIFTVSPVRYTRDGLMENQRSKAVLHLAVDALQKLPNVYYFPSFELFVDELRDYRFYANDMIHPGQQGISFTWEKFKEVFFDKQTMKINEEVERLVRSSEHHPIHPHSDLHLAFLNKLKKEVNAFQQQYPQMDFGAELSRIEKQLT